MSVTYTDGRMSDVSTTQDAFVPRYARAKRAKKGVRTWMILAPIGALVLVGGGAAMMMSGGDSQPLVEPAPTPAVQPLTSVPAPLESSAASAPLTANAIEPAAAPVPVVREATPAAAPTPAPVTQRRAIPTPAPADTPAAAPREAVVEPTGPRPYTAEAGATTAPAPAIQTAPLT